MADCAGPVAQWLEHGTHNAGVLGSSPSRPTSFASRDNPDDREPPRRPTATRRPSSQQSTSPTIPAAGCSSAPRVGQLPFFLHFEDAARGRVLLSLLLAVKIEFE